MFLEINPLHPADHKLSRDGSGLPVSAVTLDDLVPDKRNLRPALVKIDVQGAEMLVLMGATGVLTTAAPALFIELHEEGLNKFGTSVCGDPGSSFTVWVRTVLAGAGRTAGKDKPRGDPSKDRPDRIRRCAVPEERPGLNFDTGPPPEAAPPAA